MPPPVRCCLLISCLCAALLLPPRAVADIISVPSEQPTIQAGIDASQNGDIVEVDDGTYTGLGNRDIQFNGKDIIVRSLNGAATCTIDIESATRGVVFDGEPSSAILEGFTITGGRASHGAGIYVISGNPTILRCTITSNQTLDGINGTLSNEAGHGGPGAGVYVENGNPTFEECIISDNTTGDGGTGFVNSAGPGGNKGGNGGDGAGVYVASTALATLRNCILSDNVTGQGGAGGSSVVCVPPLSCQTFGEDGGRGGDGGGVRAEGVVTAMGCLFSGNATGTGGAAGFGVDPPLPDPGRGGNGAAWSGGQLVSFIVNSTFSANTAAAMGGAGQPAGSGGGLQGSDSVSNSIFWGNSPDEVSGTAVLTFCDVQGGYPGTGNIQADPLFADAGAWDFRLQDGSPCIDSGLNTEVPASLLTDLDGAPRIFDGDGDQNSVVDMGAYEFRQPTDTGPPQENRTGIVAALHSPGEVRIAYHLAAEHDVELIVLDVRGRHVRTLTDSRLSAGDYEAVWDGRDHQSRTVSRGVYFARLRADQYRQARKLLWVGRR